jgi:hypothetical protein
MWVMPSPHHCDTAGLRACLWLVAQCATLALLHVLQTTPLTPFPVAGVCCCCCRGGGISRYGFAIVACSHNQVRRQHAVRGHASGKAAIACN